MILNRALMRETLQTSGAVGLVLLSIFLVIRLVAVLRQAAEGVIPLDSVVQMLFLRLMTNMDIILPLVLYVAVLMVLGRWSRDNEMTVITACGISPLQFLKPMAVLAVMMSLLVGVFSLYLSPLSVRVIESIQQEYENRREITGINPGVFTETRQGGVYFIERFNESGGYYENIFFYGQERGEELVVIAGIGFQSIDVETDDLFLVLKNGTRYTGSPGEPSYTVVDFETYAIRLEQNEPNALAIPVKGMPTAELLESGHRIRVAELNWRLSKVMVIPVLILFALSFSSVDNRRNRVPAMIFAFLVYFGYANLIGFAVALMRKGQLNPHLGVWYVHGMFIAFAAYVFWRKVMNRPLIPMPLESRRRARRRE
ncbi:MAG: LPS export ABC transporter permease LptF [Proteobacteria bacterium]|nr:MAG: LPS export ABC transporter permease LptF [Pseudomonadota bacterium]